MRVEWSLDIGPAGPHQLSQVINFSGDDEFLLTDAEVRGIASVFAKSRGRSIKVTRREKFHDVVTTEMVEP
jgi:hypothetical protein